MTVIKNASLIANGIITECDILIDDGKIAAIDKSISKEYAEIIDADGLYLSHGFVDCHVHGGGGFDFMDGTKEAWHGAAALHLRYGSTNIAPTTLAAGKSELLKTFEAYNSCKAGFEDGSKFLGLHIEGPYLSKSQSGAQDKSFIRNPDPDEYKELIGAGSDILRWTIAPELPGAAEMGDYLAKHSIVPCIGHSDATYEQVCSSLAHGYRHITHLYSATSTVIRKDGFRYAGIVESAYLLNSLTSEVIADGCHLPPPLLTMAYRFIGADRLCLITDAMRAAGQTEGESILGSLKNGQRVILEDGVAKMPDRKAFAGSVCTADRLVRNMVKLCGVPLPDAIKMITETPARVLGVSDKCGTVAVGRAADLVLFDGDINIKAVFTDGIRRI